MSKQSYAALIIDRNQDARKSLASVLRQGLQLTEIYQANSAKEAHDVLKNAKKIDWIFCDTSLPDEDCFAFIDEAKKLPLCANSSFILLSSQTNKELLIKAASNGVSDFIKKPFTTNTLIVKLRKLMTGEELRSTKRHSLLGAYKANLNINNINVESELLDVSLGGCQVTCKPVASADFNIYNHISISIPNGSSKEIFVTGEVVRMERNPSQEEKMINVAFQFVDLGQKERDKLTTFIAQIKSPKKDEPLKKTA